MKWIQGFTNPSIFHLYLINPGIHRIVILYDTFLFISFTLKIRFHHNVWFGWDWCKTLECYINRTLRHARWMNVIYTGPYVMRGEYNVLSKIVTRDVSQSEKNNIWSHITMYVILFSFYWYTFLFIALVRNGNNYKTL
jgi:hypothetical protein